MTTIDKLDLSVYNLYAIRTRMIEQTNQQLRLDQASSVPPQIQVVDIYPKMTELDILLGITPLHTPWAYFFPPVKFRIKRRSPFGFSRLLPSLFATQEEQDAREQQVAMVTCSSPEEEHDKQAIIRCFSQISTINRWLSHIVGRVAQFLKG